MTLLRNFFALTLTAGVIASVVTVPASAAENSVRLVENPDGTLSIERGASLNAFSGNILAESNEVYDTYIPEETTATAMGTEETVAAANSALGSDPMRPLQWNLDALAIDQVADFSKGAGVTVAVLDTGVDASHPDFEGRVIQGYVGEGIDKGDKHGHGTHVAGIIGAGSGNGIGVSGIAPNVTIWDGKITFDNGSGNTALMAEGIVEAINAQVDVISISMTSNNPDSLVEAAIDQAVARGIPVVAAAGNEGLNGSPKRWPAAYDKVIAVGATQRNGELAPFSNNNEYVDVTAPGAQIYSLAPGGKIVSMSGTSQAAPSVSALIALAKGADHSASGVELGSLVLRNTVNKEISPVNVFAHIKTVAKTVETEQPEIEIVEPEVSEQKIEVENNTPEQGAPVFHNFARLRSFERVIR